MIAVRIKLAASLLGSGMECLFVSIKWQPRMEVILGLSYISPGDSSALFDRHAETFDEHYTFLLSHHKY